MSTPPVVVVMGVSGSGKTTLGTLLAERLGVPFEEGDELHPASNIAKMRSGIPLTDADRGPWLDAVAGWIGQHADGGVISCSALKLAYRDRLRSAASGCLWFVFPEVEASILRHRLQQRRDHFMPLSLLASQLATLEPPSDEPDVIRVDGSAEPGGEVAAVLQRLAASAEAGGGPR